MISPSIIIADNLSVNIGAIFTQKDRLRGQYSEGQSLRESLDFDQLHEKKHQLEWFVSIAFRFESNPFKKKEDNDSKSEEEKKE